MPQETVNKLAYLELPATSIPALKTFYGDLFGWTFQDFGDDYAAIHNCGLEAGFNADAPTRSAAPLAMIETADIHATLQRVETAGGTITQPLFAYPGGQRFHFRDPAGNELAIIQPSA